MNLKTISSLGLGVALSAGVGVSAIAQDGAELYVTKTCVSCHGQDAKTPILPNYPSLAGQNAEYLVAQLGLLKSGARSNGQSAAMIGIMTNVNDEEMRIIADWLAAQP